MGRRIRRFLIIIPAAAVILLSLLLATCSNEFDIFEAIKTEMKIANDLFLEISDNSPAKNATLVSQLERIEIEFDRSINTNTVDQSSIVFDPAPGTGDMLDWSFIYNDTTRNLFIYPDPVLSPNETYTVTVNSNLKGTDGSDLQDPYSWSFETTLSPTGNFFITKDILDSVEDPYTKTETVDLWIYAMNSKAAYFYAAETEIEITGTVPSTWPQKSTPSTVEQWYRDVATNITLTGEDGIKTVYMGFSEGGAIAPEAGQLKADTIILDRQGPTGVIQTSTITTNTSRIYAYVTDAWSGVASYNWTAHPDVTLTSTTVEDPYISSVSNLNDVYRTFTLVPTDGAGNPGSISRSIKIDTIPPDPPKVSYKALDEGGDFGPVSFGGAFYWYWETGKIDDPANVFQYYRPDIDYLVKETKETEYKTEVRTYGPYDLDVRQFDDDGNLSDTTTLTLYFSPTYKELYPVWGQNNLVEEYYDLMWPGYKGEVKNPVYDLYVRVAGAPDFELLDENLTDHGWKNGGTYLFKAGNTYEWFLMVKDGIDGKEVDGMPAHPKTGLYYCFTVLP